MRWVVVTAAALVGTSLALAAPASIDGAADVNAQAERVFIDGQGLLFPIDPLPVCEVFDNYGGHSKTFGSGGHQGVDIGTAFRQEVYAVEDGVLYREFSGSRSGLGWGLWSDTDTKYRYYHLDSLEPGLAVGDRVTRGQLIGHVGDTGNAAPGGWHLHFEVRPGPEPHRFTVDPVPLMDIPSICNVY